MRKCHMWPHKYSCSNHFLVYFTSSSLPLSYFFVCIRFVLILVQASFLVHTPRPLIATPLSSWTAPPPIANPLPRLKSETVGFPSRHQPPPSPQEQDGGGGFPSCCQPPPLPQEQDEGFPLIANPPPLPQEQGGGLFTAPAPLPRPKSKAGVSSHCPHCPPASLLGRGGGWLLSLLPPPLLSPRVRQGALIAATPPSLPQE